MNAQPDRLLERERWAARTLALPLPPLPVHISCGKVYEYLVRRPEQPALAVVSDDRRVLGLVNRFSLLARYAQRFTPELFDRKPIIELMDPDPLVVDGATSVEGLGARVAIDRPQALVEGFVITADDRYLGVGTGQALMRRAVELNAQRTRDLQLALETAARANQAKSEFLALMSHELRTPLNAILGFSDVIRSELYGAVGNLRYRDYAGDIHDAGSHLLSIINDILDLSKAEAGKLELHPEPMDLRRVVAACLRLVKERAHNNRLALSASVPVELPPVEADERKVKQILINLLSNAIKFTPAGGRVAVTAALADDGAVLVRVSDSGIGMAADAIPQALAPFGQIDSSLARKFEGTGLGLPLTKALIELHGGWLELDSTPDVGTTVTVAFPPERVLVPAFTSS